MRTNQFFEIHSSPWHFAQPSDDSHVLINELGNDFQEVAILVNFIEGDT